MNHTLARRFSLHVDTRRGPSSPSPLPLPLTKGSLYCRVEIFENRIDPSDNP